MPLIPQHDTDSDVFSKYFTHHVTTQKEHSNFQPPILVHPVLMASTRHQEDLKKARPPNLGCMNQIGLSWIKIKWESN